MATYTLIANMSSKDQVWEENHRNSLLLHQPQLGKAKRVINRARFVPHKKRYHEMSSLRESTVIDW